MKDWFRQDRAGRLADEIIGGRRLRRGEDLSWLTDCDLEALCQAADRIRQALAGDKVDLCTIINGKAGRCSEDCKFCAQSARHPSECETYSFLDADAILNEAKANEAEGVDRFAVVTAGRALKGEEFEQALAAYRRLREETGLDLCASMGLLTKEQLIRLKEAGITRYHENIETSRRNFPNICTTHTYDDKIQVIRTAQEIGLSVCSGGIIGMGESWDDRIDMAISLAELGIRSIPINALMPIAGTPLEALPRLSEDEIRRTVAIFRFIVPEADIRLAAGRALCSDHGAALFCSGASSTITGNMLTTTGTTIESDRRLLKDLGRQV
ncbi:MAG: biotin synthase BioB [Firmicutes bacterium]|nr:biotin synthase BioB [Bacillota bacterium]